MKAYFFKHNLEFNMPSRTSRDVLYNKPSWYLVIKDQNRIGIGECSIIPGLSLDRIDEIETKLDYICREISSGNKLDIENLMIFQPLNLLWKWLLKILIFLNLHSR